MVVVARHGWSFDYSCPGAGAESFFIWRLQSCVAFCRSCCGGAVYGAHQWRVCRVAGTIASQAAGTRHCGWHHRRPAHLHSHVLFLARAQCAAIYCGLCDVSCGCCSHSQGQAIPTSKCNCRANCKNGCWIHQAGSVHDAGFLCVDACLLCLCVVAKHPWWHSGCGILSGGLHHCREVCRARLCRLGHGVLSQAGARVG